MMGKVGNGGDGPIARLGSLLTDAVSQKAAQEIAFKDAAVRMEPDDLGRLIAGARRIRESFFSRDLFGEPAWDMLINLTIAHQEDRSLKLEELVVAGGAPPSTGYRWMALLKERGLLETSQATDGGVYVGLTACAIEQMRAYTAGYAAWVAGEAAAPTS